MERYFFISYRWSNKTQNGFGSITLGCKGFLNQESLCENIKEKMKEQNVTVDTKDIIILYFTELNKNDFKFFTY